jgi:hypothetical protein
MPEHKDAITAILGASASMTGLLLVFIGLLVPGIRSGHQDLATYILRDRDVHLPRETARLEWLVVWLALVYVWGLFVVLLSLFWLLFPGDVLFWCAVVAFLLEVIGLIVLGVRMLYLLIDVTDLRLVGVGKLLDRGPQDDR